MKTPTISDKINTLYEELKGANCTFFMFIAEPGSKNIHGTYGGSVHDLFEMIYSAMKDDKIFNEAVTKAFLLDFMQSNRK